MWNPIFYHMLLHVVNHHLEKEAFKKILFSIMLSKCCQLSKHCQPPTLHSCLKTHKLSCEGNKWTMADRLYQFLQSAVQPINNLHQRLISERRQSLLQDLQNFHSQNKCTKCHWLVNYPSHAGSPAGQIFSWRLIDLNTKAKKMHHHHIWLTLDAQLDLQWWLDFYHSAPRKI